MTTPTRSLIRGPFTLRAAAYACFLASFLASAAYVLAWAVHTDALRDFASMRMKANTALVLALLSFTHLLRQAQPERRRAHAGLLAFAGLIAAASGAQYVAGRGFGIDELWALDARTPDTMLFPGRMSPNAAACLVALALEPLLSLLRRPARRCATLLLALTAIYASVVLLGYSFGATSLYRISVYVRMSPYTATLALLLCLGRMLETDEGMLASLLRSRRSGTMLALRLSPALLLTVLAGWLEVLGRNQDWWGREEGMALLVSILCTVSFFIILRTGAAQNALDETKENTTTALRALNELSSRLAGERDLQRLTQLITDTATKLTGAQFGAFFYNTLDDAGESYMLYTVSGVPIEAFSKFPMPRNTAVFAPTFAGTGIVRSANIRKDPRYGKTAPHHGMPDGHLPVTSYMAVPVISRSGKVLGGLFFGHREEDVFSEDHERLSRNIAAQAAVAIDNSGLYRDLSHAVKARDDFLSMASHELKTPLTSLSLQLQLAERKLAQPGNESARRSLEICQAQARRLNELVDDLLDVARIESGKLGVRFDEHDVVTIAREAALRMRDVLNDSRSALHLDLPDSPVPAELDRFRLDQVLDNLLSNAAKYGAGHPVRLGVRPLGDEVEIRVADEGIGIPKDKQALIFSRFERVGGSANVSGLGLGLFISREIVNAHGGSISFTSDEGRGAVFTVRLPRRQPRPAR